MSFTVCTKTSTLDVWQGSEYASELASKIKEVSFQINLNIKGSR